MGRERKFIADVMMGGFVRLMRIMGFDVEYSKDLSVEQIIEKARKEKRVIVTRRKSYRFPPDVEVIVMEENYPHDQVKRVFEILGLEADEEKFLSRCLICNRELEDVEKEEVKGLVPEYVFKTKDEFARCPSCGRIYWEGTHHSNMAKMVEMFLKRRDFSE